MTNDDDAPATKGDLKQMATKDDLKKMATKDDLKKIRGEMSSMKDEILRHFDVVAEDIRHDLQGANRDEIEVLKDGKTDHEQRIVHLEQVAGMRS